jgi:hypothetical protein
MFCEKLKIFAKVFSYFRIFLFENLRENAKNENFPFSPILGPQQKAYILATKGMALLSHTGTKLPIRGSRL